MKKKQKILIVDDSKLNQQILAEVLGEQYAYLYADDGMQALEVLSANLDLSLILLDIHMPKMDGLGVLNVMKERQWVSEVPVIVISAEEDMTFIQKAYDLGATDYINRPINMTIVQRRVSNTILLYEQQHRLVHLVRDQVYEREKINSMMISILSNAIETRNHESGAHVLHVRVLTEILLRRLIRRTDRYQLSQTDISQITMLSALHDIGKIRIPEGILNKPGKLDPDEWEKMKQHTVFGDEILQQMADSQANPFIRTAREICRNLLLEDIAIRKAVPLSGGTPVLQAGGECLLAVDEDGARRAAVVGFDVHDSNLPLKADFPVLIQNLLAYLLPDPAAEIENAACGESVVIAYDVRSTDVSVLTPSGKTATLAGGRLSDTQEVGLYTLRERFADGASRETRFALHIPAAESNTLIVAESSEGAQANGTGRGYREWTLWALLALFALAVAEWEVSRRGA